MTGWGEGRLLALDTESTGVDVESDRIVTACAAIVDNGTVAYQRSWLLAVEVEIPAEAEKVHGISTAKARAEGVDWRQGIREIAGAVQFAFRAEMSLVLHNAPFDLTLLDREVRRIGDGGLEDLCGGPVGPVVDTLCVDKAVDRYRPGSRKLVDTAAMFGVDLGEDAHEATADALAACEVARRMWLRSQLSDDELFGLYADRRYPDRLVRDWQRLGRMSAVELHEAQIGWYKEQSEGFAQYLRRCGNEKRHEAEQATDRDEFNLAADLRAEAGDLLARADSVDVTWPLRPVSAAVSA
mgnify:CR=1 FL=1